MDKTINPNIWPDDLLVTKLNIPSPHFQVVRRERLTQHITPEMDSPIISVVAPAGYGKTTFITDSLSRLVEKGWSVIWLSLDGLDNSPIRFWSYIIASINRETSLQISTNRLLQQSDCFHIPQTVIPIINAISEWKKPVVIALDDYHSIDDEMIHQSLSYLINHRPDNLQFIISSRKPVPFSLFRQKTEHVLWEVSADDLAFTLQETDHFLNTTMGLALDGHQVKDLYQMTEGWIVALQMLAISIQGKVSPETYSKQVTSSRQQLSEYLVEEILQQQPEPVRKFLLQTSVLSELSPEFCDSVLGRNDSKEVLEQIRNANLFIVSIDREQRWFRYHPLFARALQEKLLEADADSKKLIYLRAYDWLKENGYSFKAVSYAISIGAFEQAADVIEECALQAFLRSDTISLVRWINQISDEIKANRPNLILLNMLATLLLGQTADFQPDLEKLNGLLRDSNNHLTEENRKVIAWKLKVIQTVMSSWKGFFVKEIPAICELIETAPSVEPYYLGFLNNSLAEAYGLSEDLDSSLNCFERTKRFSYQSGFYDEYFNGICEIGRMLEMQGKVDEARKLYQTSLEETTRYNTKVETIAFLKSGLLSTALILNDLQTAKKLAEELCLIYDQEFSYGFPWVYQSTILTRLANYYISSNQPEQGMIFLDQVNSRLSMDQWSGCKLVEGYVHLQVEVWLREKKFHAILNWLNDRVVENDRCDIRSTDEKLMLARLYLDQQKHRSAMPLLFELESYLNPKGMVYSLIKVYGLLAIAHCQAGNGEKSAFYLEKALATALPERIQQPFLRVGDQMEGVLRAFIEKQAVAGPGGEITVFGAEILSNMQKAGYHSVDSAIIADKDKRKGVMKQILTEREIKIFYQILDGKSEKDIAQSGMISINTVKAHIRNIYKKLNIHSRREAHKWMQGG